MEIPIPEAGMQKEFWMQHLKGKDTTVVIL